MGRNPILVPDVVFFFTKSSRTNTDTSQSCCTICSAAVCNTRTMTAELKPQPVEQFVTLTIVPFPRCAVQSTHINCVKPSNWTLRKGARIYTAVEHRAVRICYRDRQSVHDHGNECLFVLFFLVGAV